MFTKRVLMIVLIAGVVISAVGIDIRLARSARALPPAQAASVSVPYSGNLSDEAGQPVTDGAYAFTFSLYGDESSVQLLWTETQVDVAVQDGAFTALLGSVTPIPKQVLNNSARWLEVQVRGPEEAEFTLLTPRQELNTTASLRPASSPGGGGSSCAHDHFGESWVGAHTPGLSVEDTTSNGDAIEGKANTGSEAIGVLGSSNNGKGVYGYSSSGISLYAGGSGTISSSANSVLYLSPQDMVVRYPSMSVELYPLDNGGVMIINKSGYDTKYLSIPVSTFGKLFGARLYVKAIRVCYKALLAYIMATAVTKNNGGAGATYYIYDTTIRNSNTYECYTLTAPTPRVPIDNSTWVQFNIQFADLNEADIYTVELTLTEEQQDE